MDTNGFYNGVFEGRRGLVPAKFLEEMEVTDKGAQQRLLNQVTNKQTNKQTTTIIKILIIIFWVKAKNNTTAAITITITIIITIIIILSLFIFFRVSHTISLQVYMVVRLI